jgi:hypothetical protein
MRPSERIIKVEKGQLVEILKRNCDKHKESFDLAKKGFQIELKEELEQKLKDLADGKRVDLHFKVRFPDNHYSDYTDVLSQLEWDTRDEIELNQFEFAAYIQDRWDWRDAWFGANAGYISTASAR